MREHVHPLRLTLGWGSFLRGYVTTMRPYLMFISGITGVAGMCFAPGLTRTSTMLIGLASFLSYGFGQALTDCFQTDTDALSAPYRPLARRLISRKQVLGVSILGLVWCISVLSYFAPVNIILGSIAGFGLWSYTFFKRRWWGGPWYNAWIVAVLCAISFLAGGGEIGTLLGRYAWLLLAVFFGYANFVLQGYFKDVQADRATRYNTAPVVFGMKACAWASDILAGLMLVAIAALVAGEALPGEAAPLIGASLMGCAGLIRAVVSQFRIHSVQSEKEAYRAMVPQLESYILLISFAASLHRPGWVLPLAAFYGLYMLAVNLRPSRYQL